MEYSNKIIGELRNKLGPDFVSYFRDVNNVFWIYSSKKRVKEISKYLINDNYGRLIHISAIDKGFEGYEVVYHYSFDHLEKHLHINVKVPLPAEDYEIDSVAVEAPQASWSEIEMMEFTPVKFLGHPDFRHLWLPYEWPNQVEGEKCEHYVEKSETPRPPVTAESLKDSLIPLGPYHPLLIEGAYFRVKLTGEHISDVDVKLGWNHRGIMKLFESRSYSRGLFLAERICGICNVTHTTAYVNALEALAGLDIPDRTRYIRTLMAELERIHSHLLWVGVAGDLIGFKTLFMISWKVREKVLDVFDSLTGSRRTPAMNLIGGVRQDITDEKISKTKRYLSDLKGEIEKLISIIYDHSIARNRLQDIGKLDFDAAKRDGAVGPTARGSGWKIDTRSSSPYAAYGSEYTTWDIITETGGDVWSRTMVRLNEIIISIEISRQCLDSLKIKVGPIAVEPLDPKDFIVQEALGKAEAPRGELLYYIVSDGTNVPHSIRIRTPSFRNNALLPNLLRGHTIADAPIIIGSIDPCYSCTDRLTTMKQSR